MAETAGKWDDLHGHSGNAQNALPPSSRKREEFSIQATLGEARIQRGREYPHDTHRMGRSFRGELESQRLGPI